MVTVVMTAAQVGQVVGYTDVEPAAVSDGDARNICRRLCLLRRPEDLSPIRHGDQLHSPAHSSLTLRVDIMPRGTSLMRTFRPRLTTATCGPIRRVLGRTAVVAAVAAAVLSITAGVANAETPECRAAQDGYDWSINNLQDATYAGNISEMRFWLHVFATTEAEVAISC